MAKLPHKDPGGGVSAAECPCVVTDSVAVPPTGTELDDNMQLTPRAVEAEWQPSATDPVNPLSPLKVRAKSNPCP